MSTTSTPVASTPSAKASLSGADETRLSMPRATVFPPRRRTSVPYARPTCAKTSGVMSIPTFPRPSSTRKMYGLMPLTRPRPSHHGDRFDFDEPVGLSEGGHRHQGGGGPLLAEELLAHRNEVSAVADVREIGIDLHDGGHAPSSRLHLRLDGAEHRAGLGHEVAPMRRLPLVVVGDLSRQEEDGLGARDLDALGVGRRIEDTGSAVPLDVGHENLLERRRVLGEYDDAAWVRSFLR